MRAAFLVLVAGCSGGESPPTVFDTAKIWGGNLAVHDGRVYTTTFNEHCGGIDPGFDHAVWSLAVAGGDEQLVFCGANQQLFGFGMTVADGRVFWSGDGDDGNTVYAVPIGGGEREQVAVLTGGDAGLATSGDHVYAGSSQEILRVPLAGGAPEVVFERSTGFEIGWIDVIGNAVFANTANEVMRMNLDGSARVILDTMSDLQSSQFCHDAAAIYFVRRGDVVRVPLDGTATTVFASGLAQPRGCGVLDGDVYTSLGGVDNATKKQIVRLRPGNLVDVLVEVDATAVFEIAIADRVLHYVGLGAFGRVEL